MSGINPVGHVTTLGVLGRIQSTAVRPWIHPTPSPSPSGGAETRRRVGFRERSMSGERQWPPAIGPISRAEEFAAAFNVSRETISRLATYESLLRQWQKAVNLVAPSTLDEIWHRHFADSAQLLPLAAAARTWVDLGSGAGFPGLVIAILLADSPSPRPSRGEGRGEGPPEAAAQASAPHPHPLPAAQRGEGMRAEPPLPRATLIESNA